MPDVTQSLRFRCRLVRAGLLAGVSTIALAMAGGSLHARSLRGGGSAAAPVAQVTAQQAAAMQQAQQAARRANNALQRTTQAIQAMRAAQNAARDLAQQAPGTVPNGLVPGGLRVAPGVGSDPTLWQGANLPTQTQESGRTQVVVRQTRSKAILTWETFNVGRETDLSFDQTAGGADASQWIALNRVQDPAAAPSRILGTMRAEGQVYVINRNGIVFGGSSQVNVHTLVASSLDLVGNTLAERNEAFRRGILFNDTDGALASADRLPKVKLGTVYPELERSRDGETFPEGDGVTVEAGARITTHNRGAAMLFGHNVVNRGTIASPDGQVIMAAGDSIYLARNYTPSGDIDPDLRGVLAGVDRGGRVSNAGVIETDRGNITLVGKSVIQAGALAATTAARANGSIFLIAGDYIGSATGNNGYLQPQRGYDVRLAPGSVMMIAPDVGGEKAIGSSQYRPSRIDVRGQLITLEENTTIYAPSGRVTLAAGPAGRNDKDASRLYIERGSLIDVAGLVDVDMAMESNVLSVDLRLAELRDQPALRDSFLRGKKISLDIRRGTKLADLTGYYDLIERDVRELMVAGGTVKLGGREIITRAGSQIDLSGGYLRYRGGYISSTQVVGANGHLYDIADADPTLPYVGVYGGFTREHRRWGITETYSSLLRSNRRYEAGYIEGRSAGALEIGDAGIQYGNYPLIVMPTHVVLDGDISASVVVGEHQTTPRGAQAGGVHEVQRVWREVPRLASLSIGYRSEPGPHRQNPYTPFGDSVTIAATKPLPEDFTASSSLEQREPYHVVLPSRYFDGKTVGTLVIAAGGEASAGSLTIARDVVVDLGTGGTFEFYGTHASIDGSIVARGGSVVVQAVRVVSVWYPPTETVPGHYRDADWSELTSEQKPWIKLGSQALIDVSGGWVNHQANPGATDTLAVDGGRVSLASINDLLLAPGSVIDVSGGGYLSASGKLKAGNGGSITLQNDIRPFAVANRPEVPGGSFDMQAQLRGYALGKGASLTIGTSRPIVIGDQVDVEASTDAADPLVLLADFFQQGGFSTYSIGSARGVTVAPGTIIVPRAQSIIWDQATSAMLPTGSRLSSALPTGLLPDHERKPMRLVLGIGTRDAGGELDLGGYRNEENWINTYYAGAISIGEGAQILMDPGSTVLLRSLTEIYIDGTILAAGGTIDAAVNNRIRETETPFTLRLGPQARLLAPGYVKATYEGGRVTRSIEAGGTVSLSLLKGSWNSDNPFTAPSSYIDTDRRSVIDVSGVAGIIDLTLSSRGSLQRGDATVAQMAGGDAGSVSLFGAGGTLAGIIKAGPGSPQARGGTLSVSTYQFYDPAVWNFIFPSMSLVVKATGADATAAVGPAEAVPVDPTQSSRLIVFADRLMEAGADTLRLAGLASIAMDGDISLEARRELHITTPVLGLTPTAPVDSRVTLSAPYVRFAYSPLTNTQSPEVPDPPAMANGKLLVKADLIDFNGWLDLGCGFACGDFGLNGFDEARFISSGDIRLSVNRTLGGYMTGRIQSAGTLTFESAQTYVTTTPTKLLEEDSAGFTIQSATSVTFRSNGRPAPVPLSVGETLAVVAPEITQAGVLRAPQGHISLQASKSLVLAPGSLTSVSLEGVVVPLGQTSNELFPIYESRPGPQKKITLGGPEVTVATGAVVDVSGGGDLHGFTFIPGNGGSRDILNDRGVYAVVPSYRGSAPPISPQAEMQDGTLRVGDSVYLSGVPGLADGTYTLLPAHYAMMPGAFAVKVTGGALATTGGPTLQLPDGSYMATGYRMVAGTAIRDAQTSRIQVMPQSVVRRYSQYEDVSFNQHALKGTADSKDLPPRRPIDAGALVLNATEHLALRGEGRFAAPQGGLLGNLDIVGGKIAVVGSGKDAPEGFLAVNVADLNQFGTGSLLIGGSRSRVAKGTRIEVAASNVIVDTGAGSVLSVPDLILVASEEVNVSSGSVIQAAGAVSNDTAPLLIGTADGGGDGALLRVSTGDRVVVTRSGASGGTGQLTIGGDVVIGTPGSIGLDATGGLTLAETAVLAAPKLSLSSISVSIGEAPAGTVGAVLSGETLRNLSTARDLLIRSAGAIAVYGDVTLGGRTADGRRTLGVLTLDATDFIGVDATANLVADAITIRNKGTAPTDTTRRAAAGSGVLTIDATQFTVGTGTVAVTGFAAVRVAAERVTAVGTGAFNVTGDVTIASNLVTADKASDYTLAASGALALMPGQGGAQAPEAFGGRLRLVGREVSIDTVVNLPAGIIEATAQAGNVTLGDHAQILVRGVAVPFHDLLRFAAGGTVRLTAEAGQVAASSGARIDVSGSAGGGDAGRLAVKAGGSVDLAGALLGAAAEGFEGGSFTLDARSVGDFSVVNRALNAGGWTAERSVRLRDQSLALAAGEQIVAHDVLLRSDTGSVTVAGAILAGGNAANPDGGSVRLEGRAGVTLAATGRIVADADDAHAGAYAARSGRVEIVASGGSVALDAGSSISVTGGARGGGTVIVAARRNGGDILVDRLAAHVDARTFVLQGDRQYTADTLDGTALSAMLQDAADWMSGAGAIRQRLGTAAEVRPGIVVTSSADLVVNTDIDLHGARYEGVPGTLTLQAAGAITVNGSISDGFSDATANGALLDGRSWSYRFESGTDLTIGAGRLVRTGTGDIALAVGRDLKLGDAASSIYTAGRRVADAAGYVGAGRLGDHPLDGGDVTIDAGRDISYTVPGTVSNQFVTSWLFRYGRSNYTLDVPSATVAEQTGWSVYFPYFQGMGALGGGNVDIRADRDIRDITVAVPTTGQQTTAVGARVDARDLVVRGGGNLSVQAGGDVFGGIYLAGLGRAEVVAGGSLAADAQADQRTALPLSSFPPFNRYSYTKRDLHAIFAISDASLTVAARGDVQIEAVIDPMMVAQTSINLGDRPQSYFVSYAERTAVDVSTTSGEVNYFNNPWAAVDLTHGQGIGREIQMNFEPINTPQPSITATYLPRLPGTVRMQSQQGDIVFSGRLATDLFLVPSTIGTLDLLAGDSIMSGGLTMLDVAPQYWRTALAPFDAIVSGGTMDLRARVPTPGLATNYERGGLEPRQPDDVLVPGLNAPLHALDRTPAHFYAQSGSISLGLTLPKPVAIAAGKTVSSSLQVQHNAAADVSHVFAGRDLQGVFTVLGAGRVNLEAGRDINVDVQSAGNYPARLDRRPDPTRQNLALRDVGADITMTAGLASPPTWGAFAEAYLNPDNPQKVVRTYLPELRSYMEKLGYRGLDGEALRAAFRALPLSSQQPLLRAILFSELKETGIDVNIPDGPRRNDYSRGYDAITRLFPTRTGATGGDIEATRRVDSLAGGRIEMLAPHGAIMIGVENPGEDFRPNDVGVVTRKGGDIHIMSHGSIDLGRSRVFTLQGGDIIMWTSEGDITAGTGSKTTAVYPPLAYTTNNDGFVSLNLFGLQTGAGIGALDALRDGQIRSRIDLIAPHGEVNAGDAGIRVTGNINIAALRVVGIDNIQVGGTATGIPKAAAPQLAGTLSADQATAAATKDLEPSRRAGAAPQERPSIILVEVLGYGGAGGNEQPPRPSPEPDGSRRPSRAEGQDPSGRVQVLGVGDLTDDQTRQLVDEKRRQIAR